MSMIWALLGGAFGWWANDKWLKFAQQQWGYEVAFGTDVCIVAILLGFIWWLRP